MATILRRRNHDRSTSFLAQVRVKPFKPAAKTFPTRAEALAWAEALESSLRDNRNAGTRRPDLATLTVADLIREYLADDAATSLRSFEDTSDRLAWWVNQYGTTRVTDIDVLTLREARDRLCSGRKPATVNRYLAGIRGAWNWGRAAGLVAEHRAWPRRLMLTEPQGRARYLSDVELGAVLDAARAQGPVAYAAVTVALASGIRRGELLRLKWADLDMGERPTLRVLEAKNGTARAVHLPAVAVAALKGLRLGRVVAVGPVFLDGEGKPLRNGQLETYWRHIRAAAALKDFRWHDLRHSCASYLAQNGATLLEIGAVLGHKSPTVTQRYAHLVAGKAITGHAALDAKLSGSNPQQVTE